jgi:hypothetical protein
MKLQIHRHLLTAVVLVGGSALLLAGCMGSGGAGATTSSLRQAQVATTAQSVADASQEFVVVAPADSYSSFQSKDPFVQQQVITVTTQNTSQTSVTPPASSTTTTTTAGGGSTTTTSSTSTTSTSSSTTSTTSFYTHMLQVLTVGVVDDAPAVTFQVDNNVYQNQRIGDSVSTSWGDVKVVGINTDTKVVTLLHDGQTLNLAEHQILFE